MTTKDKAALAAKIVDDSDGTIEDMAHLAALHCHMTKAECEAFLTLAVKLEIENLLEDSHGQG